MRAFCLIIRRELGVFYRTSGSYILYLMFLLVTSLWIFRIDNFLVRNIADFSVYFSLFPYILSAVIPALTMGTWTGEKIRGTYDLLMTQPISIFSTAAGKYAAVLFETLIMILLTVPVPLTLSTLGNFDIGQIITQYAGIILFSSTLISIGLFVSSLCVKQMQAYIITLTVLVLLILPLAVSGSAFDGGLLYNIARYISPSYHLDGFRKGIIDSRDLVFYFLSTILFVFLSSGSLRLEKWS